MKREYNELIKQAGTITALLGGAIVSCSFANPLVQAVLGGVLTNILSNKLEQSKLLKLQEIISKQDPANLNHNLEKLTQEAIIWAIKNISFKYKAYCTTQKQIENLNKTEIEIINSFEKVDKTIWKKSEELIRQIDKIDNEDDLIQQLVIPDTTWPIINKEFPFPSFFQDEFVSNFQLCFGELLKDKDHHEALIAYNRNISSQIQKSIVMQDIKIEKLLIGNQALTEEIRKLSRTPQKRFEKKIVFPKINIALDKYLKPLHNNVQLLVGQNGEILSGIRNIKKEVKHHTQKIEELGNKVDRNLNNKYFFTLLPIIAIALAYFAYKYWLSTQPFIATVAVDLISASTELPVEEALITLYYGDKAEKLITNDHEAIFKGLPNFVNGDSIRIAVSCSGFTPIDTQLVAKNIINLSLHRDDSYAIMQGRVKDADSGHPIEGVSVRVQDVETQTDLQGQYILHIPEVKQKTEQRLILYKHRYKPWERIEPVIKNIESIIQLEKQ